MDTSRTAPRHSSVSTDGIAPGERVDFWREVIGEKIVPVDFRVEDHRSFSAGLQWASVGDLQVVDLRVSRHVAECGRADAARDDRDAVIFNLVRSGGGASTQDGLRTALGPGAAICSLSARPFTLEFREDAHVLVLEVPRAALARNVAALDRIANRDLAPGNALYPLVQGYVEQLAAMAAGMTLAAAERVSRNLIDLVGAMLAETVQQADGALSEYKAATLIRLRAYVEQHIDDPDLGPAQVGATLGLSPRYINKLLEAEDTSLGRLIRHRRLDLIAADLRNAALAARSISTIALAHGFNDLAHFSKVFRKHYGLSPREYRALGTR